jgi:hypothetical protein
MRTNNAIIEILTDFLNNDSKKNCILKRRMHLQGIGS